MPELGKPAACFSQSLCYLTNSLFEKKEFKLKRFVLGITIWSKMDMRKQTDINREIATMIAFQHSITTGSKYRFAKYVSVNIRQSGWNAG